jgi:hydrogenase expression/formation protein HypC
MCLGIPMQVVGSDGMFARCRDRDGAEVRIDTMLVGEVAPGDWLLTFLGAAREVLEPDQAALILEAIDGLDAALAGRPEAIDAAFADLIGRTPQLPDHLRGNAGGDDK